MYRVFRPLLFRLNPETAHTLTLYALRFTGAIPPLNRIMATAFSVPAKPVTTFGLTFKNPVGLAAGYDKDGIAILGLSALGFGHIEVGTVTPRPQPGNPKPRIFRLVEDQAVINRMGFPGKGAETVAGSVRRLARLSVQTWKRANVIIGVNLGKNKDTPIECAVEDYITLMRRFMGLVDYLAINISSPNTVGLRKLQGREMLEGLLGEIAKEREAIALGRGGHKPLLVKLAPDLSDEELDDALDVILRTGMDGIIATNTTLGRDALRSARQAETGGLSGSPLRVRSEAMLGKVVKRLDGRLPVVSVGGIMNPEDAKRRLDMGAVLVQVYTGLVYAGPGLVGEIIKSL